MSTLDDRSLDQLFRTARTRNGWSDRPVAADLIRQVYDLAKMGPTSANCSPARFVWVTSVEGREKLAACAMATNPDKIRKAPVTVIIGRDDDFADRMPELFPHAPQMAQLMKMPAFGAATALRNTTLQGAYLMIAARALGLDCGPMSGVNLEAVDAAFFAGTNIHTDFICAMGYGTDENLFPRSPRLSFADANRFA
jgi:3-hydroxypropanoate dehydrogenase